MSVDGTDMIGHDIQWFLLFVGTHILPSLHPPQPENDDAIQLLVLSGQ